jgi:lipopolysaccharide transport system permease protein
MSEWIIKPPLSGKLGGNFRSQIREIWHHRHLIHFFGKIAVSRVYKRTVLGVAWLFIRPLATVAIGALFFGGVLGVKTDGVPYFLFFLIGISVWHLFDSSLMWATRSLEANRRLLKKVYFPRLVLPVSHLAPALVDFGIFFLLIIITFGFYYIDRGNLYITNPATLLSVPVSVLLCIMTALSIGFWTSVLGVNVRDVRFVLRYVLQIWLLCTPVIYPLSTVPEEWRWIMMINPMTGIVEAYRYGWFGVGALDMQLLGVSIGVMLCLFVTGLIFFLRQEAQAIDRF